MRGSVSVGLVLVLSLVSLVGGLTGCLGSSVPSAPQLGGHSVTGRSRASTDTLVYSLEVTPVVAAPGQVVSATASYLNTSKTSTLTLGVDRFYEYHVTVTTPGGDSVFDSVPASALGSPGHVPVTLILKPGGTSSKTTTFSVSSPGTYDVVSDEQVYDMVANHSLALQTPAVRIVVGR